MALGNTWAYTGTIRWMPAGSNDVLEKEIEVEDGDGRRYPALWAPSGCARRPPKRSRMVRGGPERRRNLLVAIGEGQTAQVYLLSDKQAVEVEQRLRSLGDSLIDLLEEYEFFLDFPLTDFKRFCDLCSRTRQDYMYCWVVESVEPEIARTQYRVSHRTLPDHRILEYVSGVGMTSYVYGHHGTVSEVDVRLTEVKLEPR